MELRILYIVSIFILFFSGHLLVKKMPAEKNQKSYFPYHEQHHQIVIKRIPSDLTFAGEKIHFKTPEAYEKYYNELQLNTANNPSTRILLRNVSQWFPAIEKILKEEKIPSDFKFLAVAESNLNMKAVSHKGAAGFWQFTATTAKEFGLEVNDEVDERFNWEKSTYAACRYLKQAHKQFGTWTSAAASYNRGIGGLQSAFRKQSVNSYYDLQLNKETSKYIYRILALKDLISTPKKYNLSIIPVRNEPLRQIKIDTTVSNLQKYAAFMNLHYEVIKEYNPWILKNSLTIKNNNSSYKIVVPRHARIILPQIADTNRTKASKGLSFFKLNNKKLPTS